MPNGSVKWFDDQKGSGSIEVEHGPDVFRHHVPIDVDGFHPLREGGRVAFNIAEGVKDPAANNITVV